MISLKQKSPLIIYIFVIIMIVAIINVFSLYIFWQSEDKQIAVDLHQATKDDLDKSYEVLVSGESVNLEDDILTSADLIHLKEKIQNSIAELDFEEDFMPINDPKINRILEF